MYVWSSWPEIEIMEKKIYLFFVVEIKMIFMGKLEGKTLQLAITF